MDWTLFNYQIDALLHDGAGMTTQKVERIRELIKELEQDTGVTLEEHTRIDKEKRAALLMQKGRV